MMFEKGHTMKIRQRVIRFLCLFGLWLGLGLQAHAQTDTVTYVYTDPQGTPLVKADASGNVIARYDYTPYGNAVTSLGNLPNGPGYTGHVNDPETGLVYMQERYYQPFGRFLSPDPVESAAGNVFNFNRYDYTDNNPVTNTDPDGRDCATGRDGRSTPCNPQPSRSQRTTPPPQPPPPPSPKTVKTLAAITVTATRLPSADPIAWGEVGDGIFSIIRGIGWSGPSIVVGALWPTTMGAAPCEMPGGPRCGMMSKAPDVPKYGPPGQWVNGKRRSRLYGPDGRPKVDIDNPHQGADYPHVHEWDENGEREHPGREVPDLPPPAPEPGS